MFDYELVPLVTCSQCVSKAWFVSVLAQLDTALPATEYVVEMGKAKF